MITKFKDILTPKELLKLQSILKDKPLLGGLKKLFLSSVYYNGTLAADQEPEPRRNFICNLLYTEDMSMDYNISNERLGEKVRASVEAIRLIEQSFRELELLEEKPAVEIDISNQAR